MKRLLFKSSDEGKVQQRSTCLLLLNVAVVVAVIVTIIMSAQPAHAQLQPDYFFDWAVRDAVNPATPRYTPIPLPGHDWPANHIYYQNLFASQIAAGKPTGFLLHQSEGPYYAYPSGTASPTLDTVLGWVTSDNFVFADFENSTTDEANMTTMVNKVRASTNPLVKNAYVGNYAYVPGATDLTMPWPSQTDQTARSNRYTNSGVNIAMPNCYSYAYFITHASSSVWAQYCPNQRDALFWAPLERLSAAKRNLPTFHMLIPWVNVFQPWNGYYVPPSSLPTKEDAMALIKHYRMRGADGIYKLNVTDPGWTYTTPVEHAGEPAVPSTSWLYNYNSTQYANDIVASWDELNSMFGTPVRTLLNLQTNKTGGVEWSGVRSVNTVKVLVSNLSGTGSKTADLSSVNLNGVPATSPSVADGQHQMFTYTISNMLKNGNFNTGASDWYFVSQPGNGYSATGGAGNSGCAVLQNAFWSGWNTQLLRVEPNAKMTVSLNVRGTNSPTVGVAFYTYDSAGNNISFFRAGTWGATTSFASHSVDFTVPNNSSIRYIRPTLYNWSYNTNPTGVLWVDDVVVKFAP